MPSASEELRAAMVARFGSIGDDGPRLFLEGRGFTLGKDWQWSRPGIVRWEDMAADEREAMSFLFDEWDYGGLAPTKERAG